MNPLSDKSYEQIEGFLKGELPPEEAAQIKSKIKGNPAFGQEVEWMKEMLSMGKFQKEFEILQTFNEIHKKKQKTLKQVALLSVALLALVLFFVFNKNETPAAIKHEQQAVDTIKTDVPVDTLPDVSAPKIEQPALVPAPPIEDVKPSVPPAVKKASPPIAEVGLPSLSWEKYIEYEEGLQTLGEEEDAALDSALLLMDNEKRMGALPYFEKYFSGISKDDEDYEMRLIAGKVYLKEAKNLEKAASHFQVVKDSDAIPLYKVEADFYLAIIAWESDRKDEAMKKWKDIAGREYEPWKAKTKTILGKLNK